MNGQRLVGENRKTHSRQEPMVDFPGSHSDRYETCYMLRKPPISAVLWLKVLLTS